MEKTRTDVYKYKMPLTMFKAIANTSKALKGKGIKEQMPYVIQAVNEEFGLKNEVIQIIVE